MNRLRTISSAAAGIVIVWALILASGCALDHQIQTLAPGVLKVAVTTDTPANEYDSQLWINRYVELFAAEHDLTLSLIHISEPTRPY